MWGQTNARPRFLSKPVCTVLRWQVIVTVALTVAAALLAGLHGALSAALGGAVSVCAGAASAIAATLGGTRSAGEILIGALRAEAIKIGLIVVLLWLVLATYEQVVALAFFGSFFATILIFATAFFVHEHE